MMFTSRFSHLVVRKLFCVSSFNSLRFSLNCDSAHSNSMLKQGPRPLIVCGPSGSGKSTLLKKLFEEFPDTFGFSVSHTTRKPRIGEKHGVHYNFVSMEEMQEAIKNKEFLETATFSDNIYGTSIHAVKNVQQNKKVCVLDIEIEGIKQIRLTDLNPLLVFVMPPSIEELKNRLMGRKSETPESLRKRLDTARREIEYAQNGNFHIIIHNTNLKNAYAELRDFIIKELQKQIARGVDINLTRIKIDDN